MKRLARNIVLPVIVGTVLWGPPGLWAQQRGTDLAESIRIWTRCIQADSVQVAAWDAALDSLEAAVDARLLRQTALKHPAFAPFVHCLQQERQRLWPSNAEMLYEHPSKWRNSLSLVSPEGLRQLERIPRFGPPPAPRRFADTLCHYLSPHQEAMTQLMDTLPEERSAARRAVEAFFTAHVPLEPPPTPSIEACLFWAEEHLQNQPPDVLNYRSRMVRALDESECPGTTVRFVRTLLQRRLFPH